MRSALLLALLCAPVFGQVGFAPASAPANQPEVPKPEVKPEDKCSIEGTVVNALTGEPLKKAQLHLRAIGQQDGVSYGTTTDAAGHFLMDDVDPGRYSLSADRNGFVTQSYSPQGNTKRSTTLTLANGQKLKELVFKLTPQGVIAGRILDQDGDPMARVQLQAMSWIYMRGKKQLMPGGSASTNDLGEFRMFGLRPGKYVLSATYQGQSYMQAAERTVGQAAPEEGYLTTYYPGATTPESATQLEVTPGAQIQGITMALVRTRAVRIKGRVVSGPANESPKNVMLMLVPRNNNSFAMLPRSMIRVMDVKGSFEVRGVAPGSYYLTGNSMYDDQHYSARVPIEVGDSNIEGVEVTFHPPAEVSGRVVVEENGNLNGASLNIFLQPKSDGPMMGGAFGAMKNDLTFKLTNVTPDPYDINCQPVASGVLCQGRAHGRSGRYVHRSRFHGGSSGRRDDRDCQSERRSGGWQRSERQGGKCRGRDGDADPGRKLSLDFMAVQGREHRSERTLHDKGYQAGQI